MKNIIPKGLSIPFAFAIREHEWNKHETIVKKGNCMKILHVAPISHLRILAVLVACALATPTKADPLNISVKKGGTESDAINSRATQQNFDIHNDTGKPAYDIEVLWEDKDGKTKAGKVKSYSDNGDVDNAKATKRAGMDTAVNGGPNNPVKYKVGTTESTGQGHNPGDRRFDQHCWGQDPVLRITIEFDAAPELTDKLFVSLTDINASLIACLQDPLTNTSVATAASLNGCDYTNGLVSDSLNKHYYNFYDLEDNNGFVSLTVPTSSSHTLLELLGHGWGDGSDVSDGFNEPDVEPSVG